MMKKTKSPEKSTSPTAKAAVKAAPVKAATRQAKASAKPAVPIARDAGDRKLLADVKKYGWHVVKVTDVEEEPGWAFTVGLFKTFGQPEVITFGLKPEVMHAMLNNVGELARRGMKLKDKLRSNDVIKGFACELRAVERDWYEPLLGYANWFYSGEGYPVLQCTWPDRNRQLPSGAKFDKALRRLQPSLWQSDVKSAGMVAILKSLAG